LIELNRGEMAWMQGLGNWISLLEPLHDPLQIERRQLAVATPLEHCAGDGTGLKHTTRVAWRVGAGHAAQKDQLMMLGAPAC
jgi:hypothetical protein